MKKNPCTCDAYSFPHRELSGKCEGQADDDAYSYAEEERLDRAIWNRERAESARAAL
jgi:hypothetical protein